MSSKKEAKDERDALDALELEVKEFEKDAEIERILNAFRLDAYGSLYLLLLALSFPLLATIN
jgi:DnaJ family protein C protein 8